MWSLFKIPEINLAGIDTDTHTHILPAVDDGPQSMEEALVIIRGLSEMGIQKIVSTSHIYKDFYPNTTNTLRSAFKQVEKQVEEQKINVEMQLSAEYFLDEHFKQLLENRDLLLFNENHLLFEMSTIAPYIELEQIIFSLKTEGIVPILAHVERYPYYFNKIDKLQRLRDMGCSFQVNLLSLAGNYGNPVRKQAYKMVNEGWADCMGTDIHRHHHLQLLKKAWKRDRSFRELLL